MSTKVEKSIVVQVPLSTAYNQWTQFEEFPQFMGGITSVTQLSDDRLEWVAEIAGIKRRWEAKVLEQVPDSRVSWAATEGATNAGEVSFTAVDATSTSVHLSLEYEPEGLVENIGDKLNVVENRAEADLERFKAFIESEGYASGAWRGAVGQGTTAGAPGVEAADASRGDDGKAGVSGKAVAAGIGLAAAAATAVGVAAASSSSSHESDVAEVPPAPVPTTPVQTPTTPAAPATPASDSEEFIPGHVLSYDEVNEIVENNERPGDTSR